MIVLDTCVIRETLKPDPDPRVMAWFDGLDEAQLSLWLGQVELLNPWSNSP